MYTVINNNGTNKCTQLYTIMVRTNAHSYIQYWHQQKHTVIYNNGTNKCAQLYTIMAPTNAHSYKQ